MEEEGSTIANDSVEGDSKVIRGPPEQNAPNIEDPGHDAPPTIADTSAEQPVEAWAEGEDRGGKSTSQGLGKDGEPEDPELRTTRGARSASVTDSVGTAASTVPGSTPVAPFAPREEGVGAVLHKEEGSNEKVEGGDASGTEEGPSDDLRKTLVAFYGVHNPGRISTIDVILAQYRGKEELLIERLEQKYSAHLSYARRVAGIRPSSITAEATSTPPSPAATAATSSSRPHSLSPLLPPPIKVAPPAAVAAANENQQNLRGGNGPARGQGSGPRPGAPTLQSSATGSGVASSNYMTYLADQMRSKVENLLPSPGSSGVPGSFSGVPSSNYRPQHVVASRGVGIGGDSGGSRLQRNTTLGPSHWGNATTPSKAGTESGLNSSEFFAVGGVAAADRAGDVAFARVKALEEERAGLLAACRRLQSKAEAAAREATATEELREAGQRKLAEFAERAAAAERQARDAAVRIRALESGQATLRTEMESSVRRCAAKHIQLLSAIDMQMALRSQVEGLLEIVPPSSWVRPKPGTGGGNSEAGGEKQSVEISGGTSNEGQDRGGSLADPTAMLPLERRVEVEGSSDPENRDAEEGARLLAVSGVDGSDGDGGEDESGGGCLDEVKRRCSLLETALKASRREASEARRARDAAERTVSKQRAALVTLRTRISDLEASFAKEQGSGKVAVEAARGLEAELGLRLDQLRDAEAKLSDQAEENARLQEELRGVAARLHTASVARAALVSFCRQERTAVEHEAAEHVARAEESAAMRGEEGLARGLELARVAEEAGEKRVAAAAEETDRLGKALFAARAELAGSKEREQALRRELARAAETIAGFSQQASVAGSGGASGEAGVAGMGKSVRDSASAVAPVSDAAAAAVVGVGGSGRDGGREPEEVGGGIVERSSLLSDGGGRRSGGVAPSGVPATMGEKAARLRPAEVKGVRSGVDERPHPDEHPGYEVEL